jgi:hypothetical protein
MARSLLEKLERRLAVSTNVVKRIKLKTRIDALKSKASGVTPNGIKEIAAS